MVNSAKQLEALTQILAALTEEHHLYEQSQLSGTSDPNWAAWYAERILQERPLRWFRTIPTAASLGAALVDAFTEYASNAETSWQEFAAGFLLLWSQRQTSCYLLFPGRHHLLTRFQQEYLAAITASEPASLLDIDGQPLSLSGRFAAVVWAVTSANHFNTRRNPLPANRREVAIEELGRELPVATLVYLIDDIGHTDRFAEYVLKKIEVDSQSQLRLTPQNTVVGCSTPEVIHLYEQLGFSILPVELEDRETGKFRSSTPWEVLEKMIAEHRSGTDWRESQSFRQSASPASQRLYSKYELGASVIALHESPLLTDDGNLTESRDFNTYVRAFDQGAERKFSLIRQYVRPGRIVDIGCCTGALIGKLTEDDQLRESDFYGIEVSRQLYTECLHRKHQGAFANENVFFYQRDFAASPIFALNSVDTITTFSLTHEIESYGGRSALERFINLTWQQLALRGRWINVDVVGPENPDELVWVWLNDQDGRNDDHDRSFSAGDRRGRAQYLSGLSTRGRFHRFARDFRRQEGNQLEFKEQVLSGKTYYQMRLSDACEFMSKKDYTDNWESEMHETFCFWSFSQWSDMLRRHGFQIHPASHAFTNPWLVENRYQQAVHLFSPPQHGELGDQLPYPVTNMLLIADKI